MKLVLSLWDEKDDFSEGYKKTTKVLITETEEAGLNADPVVIAAVLRAAAEKIDPKGRTY